MPDAFHAQLIDQLPPRAWLFAGEADSPGRLLHGASVELVPDGFLEGCYEPTDDLSDAINVFGSGLRVRDGRYHFVTPSHTLESLFVYERPGGWTVSNSLAFLLAHHDLRVHWDYGCGSRFCSVALGLERYERRVLTVPDGVIWRFVCDNILIDATGTMSLARKPPGPPFTTYSDYVGYLTRVLQSTFAQASRSRAAACTPMATCSTGYDSACIAALARDLGCREALTLRRARGGESDSGRELARVLGLDIVELDRPPALDDISDASAFLATGMGGEDFCFRSFGDHLRRRILLTGFQGGMLWNMEPKPSGTLGRGDVSGSSLQEFRLQRDFIHVPAPMIGVLRHNDIAAISRSKEMEPYRLGTPYDKPIPRRVLEERGVPRALIAGSKKAASILVFSDAKTLTARAHDELHRYLAELRPGLSRFGYLLACASWEIKVRLFRLLVTVGRRLPSARGIAVRLVGDWRTFEHGHPRAVALFMAGLELTRRRYRSALDNNPSGAGRQS